MALKLFGHDPSPFVRRIRVLLDELGVPFERDSHGWVEPAPEFTAASPIQRVPMLDRGPGAKTRYVFDSRVIAGVVYPLAGAVPAPPAGAAPIQATLWNAALEDQDQNVLSTVDAAIDSAVNVYLLERDGIGPAQSKYLARHEARVHACLAWVEREYAGRSTLTPGQLAFVDIAVISAIGWLRFRNRADVAAWPGLVAIESAHEGRPSFAATRPA